MEPVTESTIAFEGDARELRQVGEIIQGFGSVVSRDVFPEKSTVEGQPCGSVSMNQVVSFKVIVVDKKGIRVTSSPKGKGIIPFVVEITLNGNQAGQHVENEEMQGNEGEFSVSFTPTVAGQHQISVSHKGRHFKGSPFRIDVVDRPLYRRDYNAVGTNPVLQFGSSGSGDGQFGDPRVACNTRGEIIVVEFGNHRVQVFDKAGKFLFKFGSNGNGNGQFSGPIGVTVDQRNNQIVVAEESNHRIQVFDEKGGFIRAFGSSGSGDGQLSYPHAVLVDSQGNYFVADSSNHRVSVFDSNGQFLRKFGSSGNGNGGNGQLCSPYGIGLMSNGNVAVCEGRSSRVSIFDSQGNFIRHICGGQLFAPYHLFVDSDDNILVANNTSTNAVRVSKSDGTLVKNISIADHGGAVGICMDPEGRIIATDTTSDRILVI